MGCGPSGRVDRAEHLETGERLRLERGVIAPGLADSMLYTPDIPSRVWRLPKTTPQPSAAIPGTLIAPPATDGEVVVVASDRGLSRQALGENRRHTLPGQPAPWYPPAVTGEWTEWVSLEHGEEVIEGHRAGELAALRLDSHAEAGGHPRHVAASGGWIGWIRDDAVVLWSPSTDERRRLETDAHTSRRLSMWGGVACWEAWGGEDVDVVCSDGVSVDGPGHQRGPDRWERWLLYVDDGTVMVIEVP